MENETLKNDSRGDTTEGPADFRLFLQSILVERCKKNSNYSLRAFAKSLRIDHATLSQILRGKRSLSEATKQKLGEALGLGPAEMEKFKTCGVKTGVIEPAQVRHFRQLALDTFAV